MTQPHLIGRENTPYDRLYAFFGSPRNVENSPLEKLNRAPSSLERGWNGDPIDIHKPKAGLSWFGVALAANDVSDVASLWNHPDGDFAAMCHYPHHGLATFTDGRFDWYASICFLCHTVEVSGDSATIKDRIIWHGSFARDRRDERRAFKALMDGFLPDGIDRDRFTDPNIDQVPDNG